MDVVKRALSMVFFILAWFSASMVNALDVPQGPVLLTVSGEITHKNSGNVAEFDREMLEALEWKDIQSFTAFTEGEQNFSGPTLKSLLEAVGAQGSMLQATAIDDYGLEIPVSDADEYSVILALLHNGKPMRVRDKGPIWVVYPATEEQAPERKFYISMIWQLVSIEVRP